jgi:hypothetical protein
MKTQRARHAAKAGVLEAGMGALGLGKARK